MKQFKKALLPSLVSTNFDKLQLLLMVLHHNTRFPELLSIDIGWMPTHKALISTRWSHFCL